MPARSGLAARGVHGLCCDSVDAGCPRHVGSAPGAGAYRSSPPLVGANLKDDEIVLNHWVAEDLSAKPGDAVELEFYTVGLLRKLETKKASFKVKAIVPIEGLHADKGLMPEFPGIAELESTHDWKAGIPIDMKKIRPKDEEYG